MRTKSIKKVRKRKKNGFKKFCAWFLTIIIIIGAADGVNYYLNNKSYILKGITAVQNSYKLKEIKANKDKYTKELIELAEKNSETIDFVYNYPTRANNKGINIKTDTKYPLFIQWDKRWGYDEYGNEMMAINGCGPTALAMVVAGLKGDNEVNPKKIAEYSLENGYFVKDVGTSWELMQKGANGLGLESYTLPLDANTIIDNLNAGNPIIVTMGPGTFTSSGHFILLTGVSKDGKIIVNDSDSIERSQKTWDVNVFLEEAENLWCFKVK